MGMFRDSSPVTVGNNLTAIISLSFRIYQVLDIVPHRQDHLIRRQFLIHKIQRQKAISRTTSFAFSTV